MLLLAQIHLRARPALVSGTHESDLVRFSILLLVIGCSFNIDILVILVLIGNIHVLHRQAGRMEGQATVVLAAQDQIGIGSVVLTDGAPVRPIGAIGAHVVHVFRRQRQQSYTRIMKDPSTRSVADQELIGFRLHQTLGFLAFATDPDCGKFFFGRFGLAGALARGLASSRRAVVPYVGEIVLTGLPAPLPHPKLLHIVTSTSWIGRRSRWWFIGIHRQCA